MDSAERPDHPFVLFNLGMTHADAGQYAEAVQYLHRCLEVSKPEESHLRKAYALLVSCYSSSGDHEQAWDTCRGGLELFPDDRELLFRSAMLHHHFGRLEDAERAYRQVLDGQAGRHFASVDRGIAGHKARHNLALVHEAQERYDKAEEQWRAIVAERPLARPAWRGLGDALLKQKKFDQTLTVVEDLKANPSLKPVGMVLFARLAERRGDMADARRELEEAVAEFPDDLEPLRELCRLLFEHADPHETERQLEQLCRLSPDEASAWHNLGTTRLRLKQPDAAAEAFRQSLDLRPDSAPTWLNYGYALKDCGRSDEAVMAFRRVLQIDPNNQEAQRMMQSTHR